MSRNLRILLVVVSALVVSGAHSIAAQGADEFHCSVSPCRGTLRPDGTGKTAHQVFVAENEAKTESVSFTCEKPFGQENFRAT